MTENSQKLLQRLAALCSKSEKCESDALQYFLSRGVSRLEAEEAVEKLVSDGFINNRRFARAFVRDKFLFNKWGRDKIAAGLRAKKISKDDIDLAFEESFSAEDEKKTAEDELAKKLRSLKTDAPKEKLREKLMRFCLSRGYSVSTACAAVDGAMCKLIN